MPHRSVLRVKDCQFFQKKFKEILQKKTSFGFFSQSSWSSSCRQHVRTWLHWWCAGEWDNRGWNEPWKNKRAITTMPPRMSPTNSKRFKFSFEEEEQNPTIHSRKGPWSKEEDVMLISLVETLGARKWSVVAQSLQGRVGKQCRERWLNHLSSEIKKEPWIAREDELLIQAQKRVGNKWSEIAKSLPGRPENAVKNRWNSIVNRTRKLEHDDESVTSGSSSSMTNPASPKNQCPDVVNDAPTEEQIEILAAQSLCRLFFDTRSWCILLAKPKMYIRVFQVGRPTYAGGEYTPGSCSSACVIF